jgi:hypothetical protein
MLTMLASPAATLTSAHRPSTGWKRRYNPRHIESLEDHSHQPRHLRQPTYSTELVEAVLKLREECQRRGIKLFTLPPRSPKLNGHVERAQRTHTEEFYEVTEASFELSELNRAVTEIGGGV